MTLVLQRPSIELVNEYILALRKGYSPNNLNAAEVAGRELEQLSKDPVAFVASIDGSLAGQQSAKFQRIGSGRLPGFRRWLFRDGEFIGSFGLRWSPGGADLPDAVPGHVGYSIVPWQRNKGYAKFGLRALLVEAREIGLPHLDLSIEKSNLPSISVARACGAYLHQTIELSRFYPNSIEYRYRIMI